MGAECLVDPPHGYNGLLSQAPRAWSKDISSNYQGIKKLKRYNLFSSLSLFFSISLSISLFLGDFLSLSISRSLTSTLIITLFLSHTQHTISLILYLSFSLSRPDSVAGPT